MGMEDTKQSDVLGAQVSAKYSLIYVITKLGLLFVYDLETATAVYRNRISPDPIFLTCEAKESGGFYAVNRKGQVLLATVNEQTIVPFVSGQVGGGVRREKNRASNVEGIHSLSFFYPTSILVFGGTGRSFREAGNV